MLACTPRDASKLTPYKPNAANAVPQIASCVNATSDTPTSLPIINVNGFTDENRISAMRVSFSSITAPRITWPYMSIARYMTNPTANTSTNLLPSEPDFSPGAPTCTDCTSTG